MGLKTGDLDLDLQGQIGLETKKSCDSLWMQKFEILSLHLNSSLII